MILTKCQDTAYQGIKMFLEEPVGGMVLLTGSAGTGKSFLMKAVTGYVKSTRKRLLVTAPTHKALRVIHKFIDDDSIRTSTIHAALALTEYIDAHGNLIFKKKEGKIAPLVDYHTLIVDESSMLNNELFYDLLDFIDTGLKIIFVGDNYQIPPVGLRDAMVFKPKVQRYYNIRVFSLTEPVRQKNGSAILNLANTLKKRIFSPVGLIDPQNEVTPLDEVRYADRDSEKKLLFDILPLFTSEAFKKDPDHVKVIAWRNKTVDEYNYLIREHIHGNDIPKIVVGERIILLDPIVDDHVVLASINEELEVMSFDIDDIEIDSMHSIRSYNTKVKSLVTGEVYDLPIVHEDSEEFFNELVGLLRDYALSFKQGTYDARNAWIDYYAFLKKWPTISYSYAITAHRSQGSTYTHVLFSMWDALMNYNVEERNRLIYTACTRSTTGLYIIKPDS